MSRPNEHHFSILNFSVVPLWLEPQPLAGDLWTICDSINKLNIQASNAVKNMLHQFYPKMVSASLVAGTPSWDTAMQQAAAALLIGNGFLHGIVSHTVLLVAKYLILML